MCIDAISAIVIQIDMLHAGNLCNQPSDLVYEGKVSYSPQYCKMTVQVCHWQVTLSLLKVNNKILRID